eukprot:c19022_g1_i1.p1 GENE.c19022_g1_i1~~c19022_g1_i1.p1  ORF type:complete len:594 (-),score=282.23 c19022_g1_i1:193-1764(-)
MTHNALELTSTLEEDKVKAAGLTASKRKREPSQSASASPSSDPSQSPSASPSSAVSESVSSSLSASTSFSPSKSLSPSTSETHSISLTPSRSFSSTRTPSATSSITPSITESSSQSLSPSVSLTQSKSLSPSTSSSISLSPSISKSPFPSSPPSVSPSASRSPPLSPSSSSSVSTTSTASESPSLSVSQGPTSSSSTSISPTLSLTPTISITSSNSFSASITPTSSNSPSISLSPTSSFTPSVSPSVSISTIPVPPEPTIAVRAIVASVQPFAPHPLERALYMEEKKFQWSYSNPEDWGKISVNYKECSDSSNQSPIDINSFRIASSIAPLVTPQYIAGRVLVRNTGNYIRLVPQQGSSLLYGEKAFDLIYIAVHTPSEHTISGERFPLELQFIHKSQNDEEFAGLSLLYKNGLDNAFIARFLESCDTDTDAEVISAAMNLASAIPKDITRYKSGTRVSYPYYSYRGSLTTPPCTEGVRWFIWSKPDHVSADQVDALKSLVKRASSRPLQEQSDRLVEYKTLF